VFQGPNGLVEVWRKRQFKKEVGQT
jgi:hypothetical protein